jgi:hypothetical protein
MIDRFRLRCRTPSRHGSLFSALSLALAAAAFAGSAAPLLAQKTDTLIVRNGDVMTGEIKEFQRGKLEFSTDAAGTIYVKWTRVSTAETDKRFEIVLDDGTSVFGSLALGAEPHRLRIVVDRDTFEVATQRVVRMARVKETFWRRLDGNIDLGVDFTQQNAKTDFSFSTEIDYKKDHNNFKFDLSTSFSRQDSQLSLDIRGSVGGVAGRFFVQSNKVIFLSGLGLAYGREQFEGQEADNVFQGTILADFEFFSWGGLDTDLSSKLIIIPVINQGGRWRISSITSFKREIVKDFYFKVSINEQFDSQPPTQGTEKNDLSLTTSFGWSF